jgi:hypothetical protein
MVVLDELPTQSLLNAGGGIDLERYPNLGAFADDATWYRHFTTNSAMTDFAVPSLLTGQYPKPEEPLWTNHPDNLFSLLAPTHHLTVFESLTQLCGVDTCGVGPPRPLGTETADDAPVEVVIERPEPRLGDLLEETVDIWTERVTPGAESEARLDQFEEALDSDEPAEGTTSADGSAPSGPARPTTEAREGPARITEFIDTFTPSDEPTLYFLHVLLPHTPWKFYETGEVYSEPSTYPIDYNKGDEWFSILTQQRHMLQAEYTDMQLGRILDELRAEGLYDDSLVVVVADHGVSFEPETAWRLVATTTADSVAYAPLLVKLPGQTEGRIDDSNLMTVDVLPTIADAIGLPVQWPVDGYPAGADEIEDRGSTKSIYKIEGPDGSREILEIVEFDDDDSFPRLEDRWIGAVGSGEDRLAPLFAHLDLEGILGASLDGLDPRAGGRAELSNDPAARDPDSGAAPGVIMGRVTDGATDGTLIMAVDGTIVSGSPVFEHEGEPGWFALMVPEGALAGAGDIRLALVDGETVTELAVD